MQAPDHVYVVILAGGSGTRFWPKSRQKKPKQLCKIGNGEYTMIEVTLRRLEGFVPPERRMIVTHKDQADGTRAIVGSQCPHILAEPEARNTAAALALAALEIEHIAPKGVQPVMISLHADHVIRDEKAFRRALLDAVALAEKGNLTLIGIPPRAPETGFGYIEKGEPEVVGSTRGNRVKSFREKSPRAVAEEYCRSGNFYWNAGLFVWRTARILEELKSHLPDTYQQLHDLAGQLPPGKSFATVPTSTIAPTYSKLKSISIDNAVLEKSTRVAVVEANMGWQDVGSWDALAECFGADASGSIAYGDNMLLDCEGVTVDSDGPLIACLGLKDMIVVAAGGAIMVCPKDKAQDVKRFVEQLKAKGRAEYL